MVCTGWLWITTQLTPQSTRDEREAMFFCHIYRPGLRATILAGWSASCVQGSRRRLAAQLPPRLVISEDDIEESFLKGSGPGGQKIVCLDASVIRSAS